MGNDNVIFTRRIKKLQQILSADNSVLIISGNNEYPKSEDQKFRYRNSNLYYLTGTLNQNLGIIISAKSTFVFEWQSVDRVWETVIEDPVDVATRLKSQLIKYSEIWDVIEGHSAIFVERIHSPVSSAIVNKLLSENLQKIFNKPMTIKPVELLLTPLREIKDDLELQIMKEGALKAKTVFEKTLGFIHPGLSEIDIRHFLLKFIYEVGCEPAFEPIVAAGVNAATLHHTPLNKRWSPGECLLLDFGVKWREYCVDITRVLLSRPNVNLKKIYCLARDANAYLREHLQAGMYFNDLQKSVQGFLNRGLRKLYGTKNFNIKNIFPHSWGHSIGLDVHDASFIRCNSKASIKSGMVVTVEPGLYFKENFRCGVRVEDTVLVIEKGCVNLTESLPSDLEEITI
ncbi:MAG: aminopeptidase P N-terminal domain-containing protein [Deltaproteobacteria bacterium]|nr:aminopeptidase P N-terminal domain-containing protein [Deltaproteobacteria bacterium]